MRPRMGDVPAPVTRLMVEAARAFIPGSAEWRVMRGSRQAPPWM